MECYHTQKKMFIKQHRHDDDDDENHLLNQLID